MKITVTALDIVGAETIYAEQFWVDDKHHPEGGSMQMMTKYYPTPMVRVNLWADVEGQALQVNAMYADDNGTTYRAVETGRITLDPGIVEKFSLPTSLTLFGKPFSEGS